MDKQTGEPYGGFCTCTVGLVIVYWKKQLCIEKIKYKFNKCMYFTGGYFLPNGIASEYLNCIEDPKIF
jgi:hypothetical protein